MVDAAAEADNDDDASSDDDDDDDDVAEKESVRHFITIINIYIVPQN